MRNFFSSLLWGPPCSQDFPADAYFPPTGLVSLSSPPPLGPLFSWLMRSFTEFFFDEDFSGRVWAVFVSRGFPSDSFLKSFAVLTPFHGSFASSTSPPLYRLLPLVALGEDTTSAPKPPEPPSDQPSKIMFSKFPPRFEVGRGTGRHSV